MKKFPKIKYPNDSATDGLHNDEVVVTEKFDGANFRFGWRDGELKIGTRNVEYDDPWDDNRPAAFKHATEYIDYRNPHPEAEGMVFFGEAMHLHSLDYEDIDWENPESGPPHVPLDSDHPNVVLFDAHDGDQWLNWDDIKVWSESLNIPLAPVIERGNPYDLDFEVPDESMFGGPLEGIVARRVDGEVRAKKVTEDFREKNAVTFNDPSKAQGDAAEFVAMFVTPGRVKDTAHGLVDMGEYDGLQMEMMQDLPAAVLKDIMLEEGWNLLCDEYGFECTFDDEFKGDVRSKTSKKCARILKQDLKEF